MLYGLPRNHLWIQTIIRHARQVKLRRNCIPAKAYHHVKSKRALHTKRCERDTDVCHCRNLCVFTNSNSCNARKYFTHTLTGQYAPPFFFSRAEFPKRETIPHLESNTKKLFLVLCVQLNNASSNGERKARCDASAAAGRGQPFAAKPKLSLIVIGF